MNQRILVCTVFGMLVSGCVPSAPLPATAGLSAEQLKLAGARSETPARISTVDFKELGDTKRSRLVAGFIRTTWNEPCDPAFVRLNGYSPNGASQWDIICKGSVSAKDYVVTIPEHANDKARVLKCYKPNVRWTSCSVVGSPADVATRTTNLGSSADASGATPTADRI